MDKNNSVNNEDIVTGEIVTGEIVAIRNEAVFIDIGADRDAVVPRRDLFELEEHVLNDLSEGKRMSVYVDHVPSKDGNIYVSISKGLKARDWQRASEYLDSGKMIELEVLAQKEDGLLVKFGCLVGTVPISQLNNARSGTKLSQVDTQMEGIIGTHIPLRVIEVNPIRNRLILSEKATQGEHEQHASDKLEVGQNVIGKVVRFTDFGAFVDIGGVEGLLHVSEMEWYRVRRPQEGLKLGYEIAVQIKDIDPDRERISLSRKALLPNPWEDVEERYSVGDLEEGTITNVTDFGAFVRLPIGVDGLVHKSEIEMDRYLTPKDVHQPGNKVLVRIISIEPDQERIGLSTRRVTHLE
jgi:ribosomal protein S1